MKRVFVWNGRASTPIGPFDLKVLRRLAESGKVGPESLVAADGEETWSVAAEHPLTAMTLFQERDASSRTVVAPRRSPLPIRSKPALAERSATPGMAAASPVRGSPHPLFDPDYDLDLLELNPGRRRTLRDFALLALALNGLVLAGAVALPFNPFSATFLLSLFVGGNVSLSWIFGVVLR